MNKTTVLAIAVAFMVGTTMSFVVSDFEAEAKKGENQGIGTSPIFEDLNAIRTQLDAIQATQTIDGESHDEEHAIWIDFSSTISEDVTEIKETTDDTSGDVGIIKLDVTDIISKQIVSKKILCGIATSPDCIGP